MSDRIMSKQKRQMEIAALMKYLGQRKLSKLESANLLAGGVAMFVKTAAKDEDELEYYLARMNDIIRQGAGLEPRGGEH